MKYLQYVRPFWIVLLLMGAINMQGQDPYFSQYMNAPSQVNPAMYGLFSSDYRVSLQYRDQWASILGDNPYRTLSATIEAKLYAFKDDHIVIAADMLRDEAGAAQFAITRGHLGFAYHKKLFGGYRNNGASYLIAAAQIGGGQNRILQKGWFGSQYDQSTYSVNTNLPSGERFESQTGYYPDINAGLSWYTVFSANASIYLGGAIHHITEPEVSFYGEPEERLTSRYVLQGGGEIPVGEEFSVLPSAVVFIQEPAFQSMAGAQLRYASRYWNDLGVRFGAYTRIARQLESSLHNDAFFLVFGLEFPKWKFGVSYDISTSSIVQSNDGRGAVELSAAYMTGQRSRKSKVRCPKF